MEGCTYIRESSRMAIGIELRVVVKVMQNLHTFANYCVGAVKLMPGT